MHGQCCAVSDRSYELQLWLQLKFETVTIKCKTLGTFRVFVLGRGIGCIWHAPFCTTAVPG